MRILSSRPWVAILISILGATFSCTVPTNKITAPVTKPNVLFIAVDDLNTWIGVMNGHPQAKTPNIDKLSAKGTLFTNAFAQAPICGPSRASVMTGLYPTTSGNYLQLRDQDIKKSNEVTAQAIFLPDYFEQNGYKSMGVGKLFHYGNRAEVFEEFGGVFEKYGPKPETNINYDPEWYADKVGKTQTDWGAFPETDAEMPDFRSAAWAVDQLNKSHDKPFFLGVGFVRPHVPWHVPQEWFDAFPLDQIQTPAYLDTDMDDIPPFGKLVTDIPSTPTTDELLKQKQWKEVVQAYLACTYFVDAQIGKVLDALSQSEHADHTIVVLWSDHGYHLGEKGRFAKQALWKRATQSVLMISQPGRWNSGVSHRPTQLIDIYPTLTALCGLPANAQNEGHSLVPLLEQPDQDHWPHAALTSYGKGNIAVSTESYRLIQYADESLELYDVQNDPNEWNNLANQEKYLSEIEKLKTHIPVQQAELSPYSKYSINTYFQKESGLQ